jgi:hypothetical protein
VYFHLASDVGLLEIIEFDEGLHVINDRGIRRRR